MKIAICDDTQEDVSRLKDILAQHPVVGNIEVDVYSMGEDFVECINNGVVYDIVFLDISIPDMNGIDIGLKIKDHCPNTYIVFVTNFPQYAIDAYDCEAFHYLLKPIELSKTHRVVDRFVRKYNERNKYHVIRIKSESFRVPISEIYYIESFRKHIIYHLKGDKKYETVGKLSEVINELKDYGFCQIHQGYIVNMDKIRSFGKTELTLDDGRKVMVSVRKRTEVLLEFARYVEGRM